MASCSSAAAFRPSACGPATSVLPTASLGAIFSPKCSTGGRQVTTADFDGSHTGSQAAHGRFHGRQMGHRQRGTSVPHIGSIRCTDAQLHRRNPCSEPHRLTERSICSNARHRRLETDALWPELQPASAPTGHSKARGSSRARRAWGVRGRGSRGLRNGRPARVDLHDAASGTSCSFGSSKATS